MVTFLQLICDMMTATLTRAAWGMSMPLRTTRWLGCGQFPVADGRSPISPGSGHGWQIAICEGFKSAMTCAPQAAAAEPQASSPTARPSLVDGHGHCGSFDSCLKHPDRLESMEPCERAWNSSSGTPTNSAAPASPACNCASKVPRGPVHGQDDGVDEGDAIAPPRLRIRLKTPLASGTRSFSSSPSASASAARGRNMIAAHEGPAARKSRQSLFQVSEGAQPNPRPNNRNRYLTGGARQSPIELHSQRRDQELRDAGHQHDQADLQSPMIATKARKTGIR